MNSNWRVRLARPRPTDDYYEERTNVDMVFHVLKVALL